MHNLSFVNISTLEDAREEIRKIGSDTASINIMAPKMISKTIKFEKVKLQDAIIIKQDMLSIGGEVAVPKNTFDLKEETADILVIGTIKQHFDLVEKLSRHYPRIRKIAEELKEFLKELK